VLDLPSKPGLLEVLRGDVTLARAVTREAGPDGLFVLPTAGVAETGDLLARNLHPLLREAAGSYDVVIIDTPPLLAGDDSTTIATMCDAVLLVVTSGQQIRRLSDAARALAAVRSRVLGVLLNRTDVPSYGYTYRTVSRTVDEPSPEPAAVPETTPEPMSHVVVPVLPETVQRPPQVVPEPEVEAEA